MFNECLIHLFNCTCLNVMWCVCAQLYMDQTKKIFDHFICIWKWFLSLFVFMFSAYIVFHCLNMFYVEKQVSKFFTTQLATRQSRVHPEVLATHSQLAKIFATEPRDSSSRETPKNSFLKGFLWETCFKPLPSSLKPLFQFCFIKTQPIWMVDRKSVV